MKQRLPVFLLTASLFVYNLQNSNVVYGKSLPHNNVKNKTTDRIINSIPTLHIDLYLLNLDSSIKAADGAVAQYDSTFSAGVDYIDAPKFTNLNESLALLRDGHLLSIERRPTIHIRDTLFFNLTNTTKRSYRFQFTATSLTQPGLFGFLKDSYTGDSVFIDLDGFTIYNFSVNNDAASQNPNRFILVYEPGAAGGILPVTFNSIKAWKQNNDIAIEWKIENAMNIESYSIERSSDGKSFATVDDIKVNVNASSAIYNWEDANALTGKFFYRVRSTGINGAVQYSQVVKIDIANSSSLIAIYPNPVKDGMINLQLTNMPKGIYQLRMLNNSGQSIITKLINHNGGSAAQTVSFNKNIPKGLYELEIMQPDNNKVTYKIQYQ